MNGERAPLLLDTHYWIWLQAGSNITKRALRAIEQAAARGQLLLSAMSVWEVAMLESKGRLALSPSVDVWIREALATPGLSLAPLTPEIAVDSCNLPGPFHGDPTDRLVVATARKMRATLLTDDSKIVEYGRLRHFSLFGGR